MILSHHLGIGCDEVQASQDFERLLLKKRKIRARVFLCGTILGAPKKVPAMPTLEITPSGCCAFRPRFLDPKWLGVARGGKQNLLVFGSQRLERSELGEAGIFQ